jgi:hypothetical protein
MLLALLLGVFVLRLFLLDILTKVRTLRGFRVGFFQRLFVDSATISRSSEGLFVYLREESRPYADSGTPSMPDVE